VVSWRPPTTPPPVGVVNFMDDAEDLLAARNEGYIILG
jgi:hypothetical protein